MRSSREKLVFVAIGGIALYGGFQLLRAPKAPEAEVAESAIVWQLPDETTPHPPAAGAESPEDISGGIEIAETASANEKQDEPAREPVTVRASTSLAESSPANLPVESEEATELDLSADLSISGSDEIQIRDLPEQTEPGLPVSTDASPSLSPNVTSLPQSSGQLEATPEWVIPPAMGTPASAPANTSVSTTVGTLSNGPATPSLSVAASLFVPKVNNSPTDSAGSPQAEDGIASAPSEMPAGLRRYSPTASVELAAREHLEYGKSLARRGAVFAAREEYLHALRLVCESGDRQSGTRDYTIRLARGLKALDEAEDFFAMSAEEQLRTDLTQVMQSHETRLISAEQAKSFSAISAMQVYCQFAAEQISESVGASMVAGETLHAMGKLMIAATRLNQGAESMHLPKSMVMYQAALSANPQDYRSANELGVLMAESGQWQTARDLFARSLLIHKTAEAWQNIAHVHETLGEADYARRAREAYESMNRNGTADTSLEWASASQFEKNGLMVDVPPQAEKVPHTAMEQVPSAQPERRGILESVRKWF